MEGDRRAAPPRMIFRRVESDGLFSSPGRDLGDRTTPFRVESSLAAAFPSSPTRAAASTGTVSDAVGSARALVNIGRAPPPMVFRRVGDAVFSLPSRGPDGDRVTPFRSSSSLAESFPTSPTRPRWLRTIEEGSESGSVSAPRVLVATGRAPPPPMSLRRVASDSLFSLPSRGHGGDRTTPFNVNSSLAATFPTSPTRPRRLKAVASTGRAGDAAISTARVVVVVAGDRAPPPPPMVFRRMEAGSVFSLPSRGAGAAGDRRTPFNVNSSLAESFPSSPTRPRNLRAMEHAARVLALSASAALHGAAAVPGQPISDPSAASGTDTAGKVGSAAPSPVDIHRAITGLAQQAQDSPADRDCQVKTDAT